MPNLQEHQLRVGAVAQQIYQSFRSKINIPEIISACLLHDVGNILKFDLNLFPQFLEPKGLTYWEGIQREFEAKYGKDEHSATLSIAKEIGISENTLVYLNAVGFSKITKNLSEKDFGKKICCYSDMRVGPFGIITIDERISDGKKRYKNRADRSIDSSKFDILAQDLKKIEKQIFEQTAIKPSDINDNSIKFYLEELKNFKVV